jgi:streptogramin lyase
MWFADNNGFRLARLTMAGSLHEFLLTFVRGGIANGFQPLWMTVGSDNKFYVTCSCTDPSTGGGLIGVATTTGSFVVHDTPSKDTVGSNGLGVGNDGNVWFAEKSHIAVINSAGTITEFAYPSGETSNMSAGVVAGPDGNVWFTEYFKKRVGRINPTTHTIKEFDVSAKCSGPQGLAVGSDGKLYFNCDSSTLAKMTTAGALTTIPNPAGTALNANDVIRGSNSHIWVAGGSQADILAEYNESTGTLTTHKAPFSTGVINTLAAGPDGNVWGTEGSFHVDVFILDSLSVTPTSLKFTAAGQNSILTAAYTGTGTLSATSANTAVATIVAGGTKNTFVVTAVAPGKTTVTVQDTLGNLFTIPVTVDQTVGIRLLGESVTVDPHYGSVLGYFLGTTSTTSQVVKLTAGVPVIFKNVDSIPHTAAFLGDATSTSAPWPASFTGGGTTASPAGTAIGAGGFTTGNLNGGQASAVYSTGGPGFYMVGCFYHYLSNKMRTVIIVQ